MFALIVCQGAREDVDVQIENGADDHDEAHTGGYEPLSLADMSGVFLILLGVYALAAVALVFERGYFRWMEKKRKERARIATTRSWATSDMGEYQFIVLHRGASCPLSLWLRSHLSDAMYRDMIAGLSRASASARMAAGAHASSTPILY